MKKKILSIGLALSSVLNIPFAVSAENAFPPQRPEVGVMDIATTDMSEDIFVGLRSNGTINVDAENVNTLGSFGHGLAIGVQDELLSLTNVVDVDCNLNSVVALLSDGTVFVGENPGFDFHEDYHALTEASTWTDIVQIAVGQYHVIGLKSDGTVVGTGSKNEKSSKWSTDGWNNVSKIEAHYNYSLGIKNDGSIFLSGEIDTPFKWRNLKNVSEAFTNLSGVVLTDGSVIVPHNSYSFSLSQNNYVFTPYAIPIEDVLNGSTDSVADEDTSAQQDDFIVKDSNLFTGDYFGVRLDKIMQSMGYTAKIVDADVFGTGIYAGADSYLLLDENGDLFKLTLNYGNKPTVEKIGENIVKIITTPLSLYYAIDHNGIILSEKSTFTADSWILTTNILYNGNKVMADVPPYISNGRTLAPIRAILEALGMTVSWDPATQTATAVKADITISVTINSNVAYVNGTPHTLDVPATITNSRTFVPVRFFAEALDMNVEWDGYTKTVRITD